MRLHYIACVCKLGELSFNDVKMMCTDIFFCGSTNSEVDSKLPQAESFM